MALMAERIPIEVHLRAEDWASAMRAEAAIGLTQSPRELSPTWLYDERGCALFDEITRLFEYYPTRAERQILENDAAGIAHRAGADTLIELGAGTSEKTRLLLDAMRPGLRRFVLFDVSEPTLRSTAEAVADEYEDLEVSGVVGDFRCHLDQLPREGSRMIAFLGGTIGNLDPAARAGMLAQLASTMSPGDSLLLGTDLVKDRDRLVAAYDDDAGVTAAFNKNVLSVLNRELEATFDPDRFDHVARWDDEAEWIEMRLRSRGPQVIDLLALEMQIELDDGEEIRTEISAKFRPEGVRAELSAAGLRPEGWWTDPDGDFALSLAVR